MRLPQSPQTSILSPVQISSLQSKTWSLSSISSDIPWSRFRHNSPIRALQSAPSELLPTTARSFWFLAPLNTWQASPDAWVFSSHKITSLFVDSTSGWSIHTQVNGARNFRCGRVGNSEALRGLQVGSKTTFFSDQLEVYWYFLGIIRDLCWLEFRAKVRDFLYQGSTTARPVENQFTAIRSRRTLAWKACSEPPSPNSRRVVYWDLGNQPASTMVRYLINQVRSCHL